MFVDWRVLFLFNPKKYVLGYGSKLGRQAKRRVFKRFFHWCAFFNLLTNTLVMLIEYFASRLDNKLHRRPLSFMKHLPKRSQKHVERVLLERFKGLHGKHRAPDRFRNRNKRYSFLVKRIVVLFMLTKLRIRIHSKDLFLEQISTFGGHRSIKDNLA